MRSTSQRFCYNLITWGIIQHLWMVLLTHWRWWLTLDCEMLSLPDTLCVLLVWFTFMAGVQPQDLVLGLPDLADHKDSCNLSKISTISFLYCDQLHLHFSHIFGCFCGMLIVRHDDDYINIVSLSVFNSWCTNYKH